jgi:hypothetical protein
MEECGARLSAGGLLAVLRDGPVLFFYKCFFSEEQMLR